MLVHNESEAAPASAHIRKDLEGRPRLGDEIRITASGGDVELRAAIPVLFSEQREEVLYEDHAE